MPIQHIGLLQTMRDLHDIPRGMERFQAYLNTMSNDDGSDLRLMPLVMMNPMGREHVAARLDEWIALDAEVLAVQMLHEAESRLPQPLQGEIKHGFSILDDLRGGWTNRYSVEVGLYFYGGVGRGGWLTTALWVSDAADRQHLRQLIFNNVYRVWYLQQYGEAKTLRALMQQEGQGATFAGHTQSLDPDDLEYSRYVLQPHLDSTHFPLWVAAMFGDEAARTLGYPVLGLSARAGFAVALDDVRANPSNP
jgi:hypothetical protein